MAERITHKIGRAFRWDFVGMTLYSLSSFLVMFIGANLIGENSMGQFAYLTTILGYFVLTAQLGYDPLIRRFYPRFETDPDALFSLHQRLFTIRALFLIVLGAGIASVYFFLPEFMERTLKLPSEFALFLVLYLVTYLLIDYQQTFYIAHYQQKRMQTINIFVEILRLGGLSLLWVYPDIRTLLWLYAVLFVLKLILFYAYSPLPGRTFWGRYNFGGSLTERLSKMVDTGRLFSYAAVAYIQRWFIFVAGRDLDLFMIGLMLTTAGGASKEFIFIYKFAFDLSEHSQSLLLKGTTGGMSHTLISEYYEKNDHVRLKKIYNGMLELLSLTTWPVAFGLVVLIPDVVRLLIPRPDFNFTYDLVVTLTWLFALTYPVYKLGSLGGTFLPATDNETLMLRYRAVFAAGNIVSNLTLFYVFKLGLYSFAISTVVIGSLLVVAEAYFLRARLNLKFPFLTYFRFFLASLVMCLVLFGLRAAIFDVGPMEPLPFNWIRSRLIIIAAAIGLGGLIYGLMLLLLKPFSPETLQMMSEMKLPGIRRLAALLER